MSEVRSVAAIAGVSDEQRLYLPRAFEASAGVEHMRHKDKAMIDKRLALKFKALFIAILVINLAACASLPVTRYVVDSWRQGRR